MNNLPAEIKKSFFSKIKNFFKKMFLGFETQEYIEAPRENSEENMNVENKIIKNTKEEFESRLKVEITEDAVKKLNAEKQKEKFLEEIEKNPNILNELSLDRLETLDKYYDEVIKKQEEKLAKLKRVS